MSRRRQTSGIRLKRRIEEDGRSLCFEGRGGAGLPIAAGGAERWKGVAPEARSRPSVQRSAVPAEPVMSLVPQVRSNIPAHHREGPVSALEQIRRSLEQILGQSSGLARPSSRPHQAGSRRRHSVAPERSKRPGQPSPTRPASPLACGPVVEVDRFEEGAAIASGRVSCRVRSELRTKQP